MRTTLDNDSVRAVFDQIGEPFTAAGSKFDHLVQPMHVVYGGADLFSAGTFTKLAAIAKRSLEQYAASPDDLGSIFGLDGSIAERVHTLVNAKLEDKPIEDLRIDFEDGYGIRTDDEEDRHALNAANETSASIRDGTIAPFFGIRPKAFSHECFLRSVRTLDIFVSTLIENAGRLPTNFTVTLPKITSPKQVSALAEILDALEQRLGIENETISIEIMVETPEAIISSDGRFALPSITAAARGRCRGAHFGAYDHTAALGITSSSQTIDHQACDFARNIIQASLANSSIWISDGATNTMPVPIYRGRGLTTKQNEANFASVRKGLRLHFQNCRRSLANGFYQGWDLHPNQLIARFAAVYAFFLENMDDMAARLTGFVDRATKASMAGSTFDDAATGQGLLNFFRRALDSGAVADAEALHLTGLDVAEIRHGSFRHVVAKRSG